MEPVPAKRDRDAAFFGFTRSICPSCKKVLDAHIVLRAGQVFLQKKCPAHGMFDVLISSNADYYLRSLTYTKPGTYPLAGAAGNTRRPRACCVSAAKSKSGSNPSSES